MLYVKTRDLHQYVKKQDLRTLKQDMRQFLATELRAMKLDPLDRLDKLAVVLIRTVLHSVLTMYSLQLMDEEEDEDEEAVRGISASTGRQMQSGPGFSEMRKSNNRPILHTHIGGD